MKPTLVAIFVGGTAMFAGGALFSKDADPGADVQWDRPVHVRVGELDTLYRIARRNGVSVDELREWNGLVGEPATGTTLLVWTDSSLGFGGALTEGPTITGFVIELQASLPEIERITADGRRIKVKTPEAVAAAFAEAEREAPSRTRTSGGTKPPSTTSRGSVAVLGLDEMEVEEVARNERGPVAPVEGSGMEEEYLQMKRYLADEKGAARHVASRSTGSGALDTLRSFFDEDRDLGGSAATGSGAPAYRVRTGDGSERTFTSDRSGLPERRAAVAPSLSKPAPKRCLAGPSDADIQGDHGMVGSKGLSAAEIQSSMNRHLPKAVSCMSGAGPMSGSLEVEIVSGCDGRVTHVEVVRAGGVPSDVAACVARTIEFAAFPAHDMPDGYTFGYRMDLAN